MRRALFQASLVIIFGLTTGGATSALSAQQAPERRFAALATRSWLAPVHQIPLVPRLSSSQSSLVLGVAGLLGGAAGLFGGAVIGSKFHETPCEDCGLEGAVYGAVAGESALLPLAIHVANGRRGSYAKSALVSLGIGAAGLGLALAADRGELILGVPVLQLISSIAIERATSR